MSTILVRTIEVKVNNSKGYVYNEHDLETLSPNPGDVYFFVNKDRGFKQWTGNEWIPTNPIEKWKRLKWGGNYGEEEKDLYYNNGGQMRDHFLSHFSPYEDIIDRGIPKDTDEELRVILEKNGYRHTWVLVSELQKLFEIELEKLTGKAKELAYKGIISEKLQRIEELISKGKSDIIPQDPDPEDTLDFLFSDEIWKVLSIYQEIGKLEFLAHEFSGTYNSENIRVHYYLE